MCKFVGLEFIIKKLQTTTTSYIIILTACIVVRPVTTNNYKMSDTKRRRVSESWRSPSSHNCIEKQKHEPVMEYDLSSLFESDMIELASWGLTPITRELHTSSYTVSSPPTRTCGGIRHMPLPLKKDRKEVTFTTSTKTTRRFDITKLGKLIFPVSIMYPRPWSVHQDVIKVGHKYTATVVEDHKVVAFCSVSKHADHIVSGINGSVFEVHNLMVDEKFRRIGNAFSVIDQLVLKLGSQGVIIAQAFGEDAEAFWRSADGFEERETDGGRYFVYSSREVAGG